MATLEKIRRRSGLLVGIIGLALFAFVIGDLFSGGNPLANNVVDEVGVVDGEAISYVGFNDKIEEIKMNGQQYASMPQEQLAVFAWNQWTQDVVFKHLYEQTGIAVTDEELLQLLTEDPTLRSAPVFVDETTGRFSMLKFRRYFSEVRQAAEGGDAQAATAYGQLINIQESKRRQALNVRVNKAVQAAMYTPTALARHRHSYNAISHDVAFVRLPYSSVPDEEVTVTDADYKAWFEENKENYKNDEETRDITFVAFEVLPSEADKEVVRVAMEEMIEDKVRFNQRTNQNDTIVGFRNAEDDSAYVAQNSIRPYRGGYFRSGELSSNVDSIMFASEIGTVYGPYDEAGGYNLIKLTDRKVLPDSVTVRHILVSKASQQNPEGRSREAAKELADSLYTLLKGDMSMFDSIVQKHSEDPGSIDSNGVYKWIKLRQMVTPFNDFAFMGDEGDFGVVETAYGFHIMEVVEQSATSSEALQVAMVYMDYQVSKQTSNDIFNEAATLENMATGKDLQQVADSLGYQARTITRINNMHSSLNPIGPARQVVKWAFGADREVEEGDATVMQLDRHVVVVQLTDIHEEGYRQLDQELKDEIRAFVFNRVKAEQVLIPRAQAMMEGQTAMQGVADQDPNANMTIQRFTLSNSSVTGVGNEPEVVGAVCGSPVGEISQPMAGNTAVYIWQINATTPFSEKPSYEDDRRNYTLQETTPASAALQNALLEAAEIVDNRFIFY